MRSEVLTGQVLDHQEASLLLPWLGTDRLEPVELEPLLDHLKVCASCRRELRDLAELGRFAELAERGEAPDGEAIDRRLGGLLGRLEAPAAHPRPLPATSAAPPVAAPRVAGPPPGAIGWRQVLPLAALVVLALGLSIFTSSDPLPVAAPSLATPYKTLSSPSPASPAGALRVVIADSCTEGDLRRLLIDARAQILGGPSRHGVYTIGLPDGGLPEQVSIEDLIAAWRVSPCFAFVEPAAEGSMAP